MSFSDDEDMECPLCMEEIDLTDKYFRPCPCGYQICRFCWNHIKEDLNGLCPACRRPYSEDNIEFKPVSSEELAKIKNAKKRKEREKKEQDMVARKQLSNVRVVQKNLVYVLGLPPKLASEEILRSNDYFGQYGKIVKVVVNRKTSVSSTANNIGIYITYAKKDEAAKAIDAVDGSIYEGRVVRATFGTTKYCSYFLRNQTCQNMGCQFLHEPGEETDFFVKEEQRLNKPTVFPLGRKEDTPEPPQPSGWAKPVPLALNNQKQFPSLNPNEVEFAPFSEPKPEQVPDESSTGWKVLLFDFPGSIAGKFGYGLVPRYIGTFNPFAEGDPLTIEKLLALRQSSAKASIQKKDKNRLEERAERVPGLFPNNNGFPEERWEDQRGGWSEGQNYAQPQRAPFQFAPQHLQYDEFKSGNPSTFRGFNE